MKNIQKALFLAVMGAGLMAPVQAEEVHMIMCGGEIREADQVVISAFEAKYSGVTVNAEFLFAITFNQNRDYMPLPAGIFEFVGYQTVLWNEMMAASLIGILPVLLIFLFMQKHLISGLTAGAVKE